MPLNTFKVYFDGSHYIGIPHREKLKRDDYYEETTIEQEENVAAIEEPKNEVDMADFEEEQPEEVKEDEATTNAQNSQPQSAYVKEQSLDDLFDKLYEESASKKKAQQREYILKNISKEFKLLDIAEKFVDERLEKKNRNLICRRMRLARKIALNEFNYFVTFTYDDQKHTEETFRAKLRKCLSNLASRKDWKYAGVWERSPKQKRLHFHGIFYIPPGTMPGELFEEDDYNFKLHRRKKTVGNTFFKEKFGRCEFDKISSYQDKGQVMCYLMKYIEKSGEKIVYSRGLARYIVAGVLDEDIVCPFDEYETKYLLFDNFICWHEGEYIGEISREVIEKMPKVV